MEPQTPYTKLLGEIIPQVELLVNPDANDFAKEHALHTLARQIRLILSDRISRSDPRAYNQSGRKMLDFIGRRFAEADPLQAVALVESMYREDPNLGYQPRNKILAGIYQHVLEITFNRNPYESAEMTLIFCRKSRSRHPSVKKLLLDGYEETCRRWIEIDSVNALQFLENNLTKNAAREKGISVDIMLKTQFLFAEAIVEYSQHDPMDAISRTAHYLNENVLRRFIAANALQGIEMNISDEHALLAIEKIASSFPLSKNQPFYETPGLNEAILESCLNLASKLTPSDPQTAFRAGIDVASHFGILDRTYLSKRLQMLEKKASRLFASCEKQILKCNPDELQDFVQSLSMPKHPIVQAAVQSLHQKIKSPRLPPHEKFEI